MSNQPDLKTFHEYFTNQACPPICNYFDMEHLREIDHYVDMLKFDQQTNPNCNEIVVAEHMCDSIITEDEVALHIRKLRNDKASGTDGIPGEFYRYITNELVAPFCTIFIFLL